MPVTQFNMKWVEQAGLVKFDFLGLKTLTVLQTAVGLLAAARHRARSRRDPARRQEDLRAAVAGRGGRHLPTGKSGMRRALLDMRPDRFEDIIALVALYRPGPMANIPTYCARKHGIEKPDYIHPKLEPILRETYGVIVYQEQVMQAAQFLAGYSLGQADLLRRAMGKKIRKEMQAQRSAFRQGRDRARHRARAGRHDLRPAGALRRIRLQQEPRRGLRAGRLPDRLHEGELSGRVHGGVDDARHGQHRQALGIPRRGRAARHQGRAAVDQSLGRRLRGRGQHDPLRAGGAQGRRPAGGREHRRGARPSGRSPTCRFRPPHQSARGQQARAGKPRRRRRLRCARAEPGARASPRSMPCSPPRSARTRPISIGQNELFGGPSSREAIAIPAVEPWLPADRLQREYDAIGFFLSGHPLDDYAALLKSMRVQSWSEFSRSVKSGANAGRVAATVVSRTERRTKTGNKMGIIGLSDPVRPLRGGDLRRGPAAVPRPARAGLAGAAGAHRGGAGRRGARPHPVGRAARSGGRASCRRALRVFLRDAGPDRAGGQAARTARATAR